ncbi:MAG: hypothetical protein CMO43_13180 [Verrucomicrobiales bacterium]|jgi:hypothetical protein|nr:hypothetical protein [Verrucomicrobiales bacterium]MDP6678321.1 DUF4339 domain-containing protein [Verrucomicrobiota bacterium]MDP6752551.1 DUF4339 domain-containing protein [Verrucomicrobiota bacterium]MDP7013772.1 DUF4339 domain-containing protein [Verrucomicrobiota bacterium]|tara:strand:- start:375 stop:857 length:483 start_codon:yes stop_codon:yes gene_type:complete
MKYFFKALDEKEYGPFDTAEIRDLLQQGRMNQDSLIRTVDSEEWRPLNDYPELMVLLAPSSSTQPPSSSPPQANITHLEPHRGALILTFGILSIVCCFPFGIAAWIMGNNDMQQIEAGMMDPSGKGITNAGKICGIIGTIVGGGCTGLQLIGFLFELSQM